MIRDAWRSFTALFEEDPPGEPAYDPLHIAGVLVGVQVAAGALFWLLWTLLVYEGGLFVKLARLARGPRDAGALEGLGANLAALALAAGLLALLHRAARPRP